ncbi:MAG TPA: hypothetical protein VM261_02615 [Kofleriaceae bacterium]|nr:hypothetical protein [Kofleriaceae bacterium]
MRRDVPRPFRFAIVGAAAVAASLAAFAIARHLGARDALPTAIRLLVSLPTLYAGYSRWMLADVLAADRARVGARGAELRMIGRVAAAVAASSAAKMLIEPWLVADLERRGLHAWIDLAPLAGDLVYGPGLAYAVLHVARTVTRQPAPRTARDTARDTDRPR